MTDTKSSFPSTVTTTNDGKGEHAINERTTRTLCKCCRRQVHEGDSYCSDACTNIDIGVWDLIRCACGENWVAVTNAEPHTVAQRIEAIGGRPCKKTCV